MKRGHEKVFPTFGRVRLLSIFPCYGPSAQKKGSCDAYCLTEHFCHISSNYGPTEVEQVRTKIKWPQENAAASQRCLEGNDLHTGTDFMTR